MKFRKKPIVIEAIQWTGDKNQKEDPEWLVKAINNSQITISYPDMLINTLEGKMIARPGDFIIRGINGEIYPCKPDIFAKTYDMVEESADEEKKHPDYAIVTSDDLGLLFREVNKNMDLGFVPIGNLVYCEPLFVREMVYKPSVNLIKV